MLKRSWVVPFIFSLLSTENEAFLLKNDVAKAATAFTQLSSTYEGTLGAQSPIKKAIDTFFNHPSKSTCKPNYKGTPVTHPLNPATSDIPYDSRPHCLSIVSYGEPSKKLHTYHAGFENAFLEGLTVRDARIVLHPGCEVAIRYCVKPPPTYDAKLAQKEDWSPTIGKWSEMGSCGTAPPQTFIQNAPGVYWLPESLALDSVLPGETDEGAKDPYNAMTPQATPGNHKYEYYIMGIKVNPVSSGVVSNPCLTVIDNIGRRTEYSISLSSSIPFDAGSVSVNAPLSGEVGIVPLNSVETTTFRTVGVEINPGCIVEFSSVSPHQVGLENQLARGQLPGTAPPFPLHKVPFEFPKSSWELFVSPGRYPSLRNWIRQALPAVASGGIVGTSDSVGESIAFKGLALNSLIRLRAVGLTQRVDGKTTNLCVTTNEKSNRLSLNVCVAQPTQTFVFMAALGKIMPYRRGKNLKETCLGIEPMVDLKTGAKPHAFTDGFYPSGCLSEATCSAENHFCVPTLSPCRLYLSSKQTEIEGFEGLDAPMVGLQFQREENRKKYAGLGEPKSVATSKESDEGKEDEAMMVEDNKMRDKYGMQHALLPVGEGGMHQVLRFERVQCEVGGDSLHRVNGWVLMTRLFGGQNEGVDYCLTALRDEDANEGTGDEFYDPAELPLPGDRLEWKACGFGVKPSGGDGQRSRCPIARQVFIADSAVLSDAHYTPS